MMAMDDANLKRLLTAEAIPPRDPAFVLRVLSRIEQRRFRRGLVLNVTLAAAGAAALASVAPVLDAAGTAMARHVNDVGLAITLSLAMLLFQRWMMRRA
jgi:hypothetical protein